jgi:hypothetical protein
MMTSLFLLCLGVGSLSRGFALREESTRCFSVPDRSIKPFFISARSDVVDDDTVKHLRFHFKASAEVPESTGLEELDGPKALDTTCGDIVEPSLRFSPPRITRIRTVGCRCTTARHRPGRLRAAQRYRAIPLASGDAARLGSASTTHLFLSLALSRFFTNFLTLSLLQSRTLPHTHSLPLPRNLSLSLTHTSFVEVIFV